MADVYEQKTRESLAHEFVDISKRLASAKTRAEIIAIKNEIDEFVPRAKISRARWAHFEGPVNEMSERIFEKLTGKKVIID